MSADFINEPTDAQSLALEGQLSEIALEILETSRGDSPRYSLAESKPGDLFWLDTVSGGIEFYIQHLDHQREIEPQESVVVGTNEKNGLTRCSEFMLSGASIGITMPPENIGIIEQHANLAYRPVRRTLLTAQDDENLDKKIQNGEVVRTHMGLMRLIYGPDTFLPTVLDLAHVEEDGSKSYIFKHED